MSFSGDEHEVVLQALGSTLPVMYEPPTLCQPPLRQDASQAYLATAGGRDDIDE